MKVVFDGSVARKTSVTVGLFNNTTDTLAKADDLSAITTEPSNGNYARVSVDLNTTDTTTSLTDLFWRATFKELQFDVDGTTGTVDSYFVVVSFQAAGDGSDTPHLFFTGELSQSRDLSQIERLDLTENTTGLGVKQCP